MDKDRQIRMLIPPFFMFASVLWEAFLSHDLQQYLQNANVGSEYAYVKTVLSLLGIVGVATLPLGYVIGLLTISVLRLPLIRRCFPHKNYEIPISKAAMEKIWRLLGHAQYEKWTLCAAARL
jgi:hypothetical protein